jgi:hypothetical protein
MYARVGVPSAIQDSTYQSNRESANNVIQLNPEIPDLTFLSKSELRKMIELLCMEKSKIKGENRKLLKKVIQHQMECVELNNTIIQLQRELIGLEPESQPVMRVLKSDL